MFDFKKAKAGHPFTWKDMHLSDNNEQLDFLFIVGKSKTDTYKEGTYIVQARAMEGQTDDDLLLMTKKQIKKKCRNIEDFEINVYFNPEIAASYSIQ